MNSAQELEAWMVDVIKNVSTTDFTWVSGAIQNISANDFVWAKGIIHAYFPNPGLLDMLGLSQGGKMLLEWILMFAVSMALLGKRGIWIVLIAFVNHYKWRFAMLAMLCVPVYCTWRHFGLPMSVDNAAEGSWPTWSLPAWIFPTLPSTMDPSPEPPLTLRCTRATTRAASRT